MVIRENGNANNSSTEKRQYRKTVISENGNIIPEEPAKKEVLAHPFFVPV